MCPGIFGYRGTLLYIPCDVISITCELGVVFRVNEISRSKPLHCSIRGCGCFLETGRKDYRMSGPGERRRVVDLYSATPMAAARVAERLGYPTGQCLECRPAKDPGYAGHMAKSIIPCLSSNKSACRHQLI